MTTMNETPHLEPLWSDENITNDAKRADSSRIVQAKIRSCLLFMRHGYEAERRQLHERIAALEAALAEARTRLSGTEAAWDDVVDYMLANAPEPEPPLPEPPEDWDEDDDDKPHYDTPGGY